MLCLLHNHYHLCKDAGFNQNGRQNPKIGKYREHYQNISVPLATTLCIIVDKTFFLDQLFVLNTNIGGNQAVS